MFQKKENNLTKEHWIDIQNCSNEELQSRNAQDIESASSNLEGVPSRIKGEITYAHPPGGFLRAPVYQNWVVIRQNELLSRQNEQIIAQNAAIISLLQNNTSD